MNVFSILFEDNEESLLLKFSSPYITCFLIVIFFICLFVCLSGGMLSLVLHWAILVFLLIFENGDLER